MKSSLGRIFFKGYWLHLIKVCIKRSSDQSRVNVNVCGAHSTVYDDVCNINPLFPLFCLPPVRAGGQQTEAALSPPALPPFLYHGERENPLSVLLPPLWLHPYGESPPSPFAVSIFLSQHSLNKQWLSVHAEYVLKQNKLLPICKWMSYWLLVEDKTLTLSLSQLRSVGALLKCLDRRRVGVELEDSSVRVPIFQFQIYTL